jgi:putative sigma-54 modulation protein
MKYQIVCNGQKLSQLVQENMIAELSRLEKLLFKSEDFECRIVVKFRNNKSKVEITIPTPFLLLRSEVEANDLMDAVEIARDKLVSQIDKVKSRLDRSSNKVNLGRTFGEAEEEEELEEIYIKNKTIHPQALTLDDAIMQMESLDHDFFIYEDIEDRTLSVVYRRKDGGYGVIDIE